MPKTYRSNDSRQRAVEQFRRQGGTRLLGSYFSADRERLRQLGRQRNVHTIDNVAASTA